MGRRNKTQTREWEYSFLSKGTPKNPKIAPKTIGNAKEIG